MNCGWGFWMNDDWDTGAICGDWIYRFLKGRLPFIACTIVVYASSCTDGTGLLQRILALEMQRINGRMADTQNEPSARPCVLIADKDDDLRAALVECASQMGLQAEGVEDGAQAMEALHLDKYDVLAIELVLPGKPALTWQCRPCVLELMNSCSSRSSH
jgi:hypothetical protein